MKFRDSWLGQDVRSVFLVASTGDLSCRRPHPWLPEHRLSQLLCQLRYFLIPTPASAILSLHIIDFSWTAFLSHTTN